MLAEEWAQAQGVLSPPLCRGGGRNRLFRKGGPEPTQGDGGATPILWLAGPDVPPWPVPCRSLKVQRGAPVLPPHPDVCWGLRALARAESPSPPTRPSPLPREVPAPASALGGSILPSLGRTLARFLTPLPEHPASGSRRARPHPRPRRVPGPCVPARRRASLAALDSAASPGDLTGALQGPCLPLSRPGLPQRGGRTLCRGPALGPASQPSPSGRRPSSLELSQAPTAEACLPQAVSAAGLRTHCPGHALPLSSTRSEAPAPWRLLACGL